MSDDKVHLLGATERQAEASDSAPPLSRWLKLSYALGEIGIWSAGLIQGFYLNPFFLEVAQLDAILTGNILLIGQIWEAISNPIIGKLTDSIHTRWGRRRPWLAISAIPFGLCFFGIFMVWEHGSQLSKFWYYLVLVILFNTFGNAINTPYTALTTELASTYDESTELTQGRMLANIVFGVAISFGHSALVETWKVIGSDGQPTKLVDYKKGYFVSALLFGLIFILPPLQAAFFLKERPYHPPPEDEETKAAKKEKGCWAGCKSVLGIWKGVFQTLQNRAYLVITIVFLLAWTTVQFVQNNLVLYCKYVLKQEEQFEWLMLVLQATAAVSLIGWSMLASKIGKQKVYWIGITLWICVEIPMAFYGPTTPFWVMYINCVIAGMGVSVAFLIPWSLIPDIIDSDELQTGNRREGVFYSLFVLFQKIGAAMALSLSSYILGATGYVPPSRESPDQQNADYQPDAVIMALRIMTGPVPAGLLAISLLVSWFYPLDKEIVTEMQGELRERRRLLARSEIELGSSEQEPRI